MGITKFLRIAAILFLFVYSAGCAGLAIPVRDEVKIDLGLPVGKIEGKQFNGIRFPFKVTAPDNWKISLEYPKFMVDLGYEKGGLQESEVFLFNPATRSNLQIDFTSAGRYDTFDQKGMESLVNSITGEFQDELRQDFGKSLKIKLGPTEPVTLKGLSAAARKYTTYQADGVTREQGWIYAFGEPYQVFILYMILEKEGTDDRKAIQEILDSFEYIPAVKK